MRANQRLGAQESVHERKIYSTSPFFLLFFSFLEAFHIITNAIFARHKEMWLAGSEQCAL